MSTVTKSPFTRPTSVMSLLADQMESSYIGNCKSQPIEFTPISNQHSNISSSAPTHRNSIPDVGFSCVVPQGDLSMTDDCRVLNESDLSSPQLPSKRLCHSSTNDSIARPIPIKVNTKSQFHNSHETSSHLYLNNRYNGMSCPRAHMTNRTPCKNPSNFTIRPIISPHYKKSAFTPTRSLTSPQTTSSDYSMSPDIESPIHRSASVTSSGFNDCSQQSLLIDPNYSPDSTQMSTCATIVNTKAPDTNSCVFPRCHSQPCNEPVLRNFDNRPVIIDSNKVCTCQESSINFPTQMHTPMKRRYPSLRHTRSTSQSESTNAQNCDSPIHCHCNKHMPNSADTSPNAYGSVFAVPKRDGYFFGSGRNYLISLPRIASSPPPVSSQADPQSIADQSHRQRVGSNSSSSTTTDANTPTVISNGGAIQRISLTDSVNFMKDSIDDIDMEESLEENRSTMVFKSDASYTDPSIVLVSDNSPSSNIWLDLTNFVPSVPVCTSTSSVSDTSDMTTKSYSTTSDGTSNCTNVSYSINSESSRSEFRDPADPPDIGFCFSQLNSGPDTMMAAFDGHSSFQELDLDQIELD